MRELKDLNDEEIKGIFYEEELTLFNKQDDVYDIQKVIKTRIRNGKIEKLVKLKNYPDSFNSWITDDQFIKY